MDIDVRHPVTNEIVRVRLPDDTVVPSPDDTDAYLNFMRTVGRYLAQADQGAPPDETAPQPRFFPGAESVMDSDGRDMPFADYEQAVASELGFDDPQGMYAGVPPGAGVHLGGGYSMYPNENIWYLDNPNLPEGVAAEAARRRMERGDSALAQSVASGAQGVSFGAGPTAIEQLDPVVGEAMRQDIRQGREERPWTAYGSEVIGGLTTGVVGGALAGATRLGQAASQLPRWGQAVIGAPSAVLGNAGYEAAAADPGFRGEAAQEMLTDPVNVGFAGALGAASPYIGPAVGAGYRGIRHALGYGLDEASDAASVAARFGPDMPTGMTTGGAPGQMVHPVPALPQSGDPLVDNWSRHSDRLEEYIRSIQAPHEVETQAAVQAAGDVLDLPLPRGLVSDPDRMSEAASRPLLFARDRTQRAIGDVQRGVAEKFGEVIGDLGVQFNEGIGVVGDRLRRAATDRLDQELQRLDNEYNAFNAQFGGRYAMPDIVPGTLEGTYLRRWEAGADEEDARLIQNVRNLVSRNLLGTDEPAEAAPGLTWEGLRDARSDLTTMLRRIERGEGGSLTTYEQDMRQVRDSLTEAMEEIIRDNAPEGMAEQMVEQFRDLDRQWAIARQTQRDLSGLFGDESVTVMEKMREAISQGGKTARDKLALIKKAAGTTEWDNATAVMIHNLGANPDGSFNPTKFAADWKKIAPDVADEIFTPAHRSNLNAIATIGERLGKMGMPNKWGATVTDAAKLASTQIPGYVWADVGLVLDHIGSVVSARRLSNPYTAGQVAKLYKLAERVGKSKTEAEAALSSIRLRNNVGRVLRAIGSVGAGMGTATLFSGSSSSRPGTFRQMTGD